MADQHVSIDEFLNARSPFVKSGDVLVKASRKAPSSWNKETRSGIFVMSAEVEDRDRDIVIQAGLDIDKFMENPVAPFSHRSGDFPVGTWSEVQKLLGGRPKRTEGRLTLVPSGKDGNADRLAFHIDSGTIKACSIGFIPKAVTRREVPEDKRGSYYYPGYTIEAAELVECSPCVIPSNPAALAKSAAAGDVVAKEIIEQVLDEWTRNPATGLIVPRAEFEAAHKAATGERKTVVVKGVLEDIKGAIKPLKAAIALHEKHMDGSAPTTGPAGEASQQKMMDLMQESLSVLTSKDSGDAGMKSHDPAATGERTDLSAVLEATHQLNAQKDTSEHEGLFRRFLSFLAGGADKAHSDTSAVLPAAGGASEARQEDLQSTSESLELAKAVSEAESRLLAREVAEMESRLAAKGITASAA